MNNYESSGTNEFQPVVSRKPEQSIRRATACVAIVVLIVAAPFVRDWIAPKAIYVQEPGHEVTGHRYLYDNRLGWRNIPNWQATTYGHKLTINSLGMRDREYSVVKPSDTNRILVLGSSYTWGYGVADDEVFTEVLEAKLAEIGDARYEVLNTGVSGWGTDQELLFLTDEGFQLAPNLVVSSFNLTEHPIYNVNSVQFTLAKPMFLDTDLQLGNVPVPKPGTPYPRLTCNADEVDLTVALIERMAETCAERKCPLVIMKFGAFHYRHHSEFRDVAAVQAALTKREAQFREPMIRNPNIMMLDLDQEFEARGLSLDELLVGNFDGHWNAVGHQHVAAILYQFLVEHELLRPASGKSPALN